MDEFHTEIRKELIEFLGLQIYGQKNKNSLCSFIQFYLQSQAKKLPDVLQSLIYLDNEFNSFSSGSGKQKLKKILYLLKHNVFKGEANLIEYITLLTDGNLKAFDVFEQAYSKIASD